MRRRASASVPETTCGPAAGLRTWQRIALPQSGLNCSNARPVKSFGLGISTQFPVGGGYALVGLGAAVRVVSLIELTQLLGRRSERGTGGVGFADGKLPHNLPGYKTLYGLDALRLRCSTASRAARFAPRRLTRRRERTAHRAMSHLGYGPRSALLAAAG
jgi:hypothetical protein